MLQGKKIILGITGSIAAYKIAHLTRLLVKEGAEVRVIMTAAATDFITPLTLATLSKNPVLQDTIASRTSGEWNNHVELGLWADLFLIAPASANTIAKMANGQCDNLLLASYLSARCPVMIAPAMDLDMYVHPAVKSNLDRLRSFGHLVLDAAKGELASGLNGQGRMQEPEDLLNEIRKALSKKKDLAGKTVLITAGPTHEAIDPVRFIGNNSSGKMGIAIADEALSRGAKVILICGPSSVKSAEGVMRIDVTGADEMFKAVKKYFSGSHIAIHAAAVADYRPAQRASQKIKKKDAALTIELEPTTDILKWCGEHKSKKQFLVGFALETENEIENARKKIRSKHLDLIVLNSLNDKGAGFAYDTNKVTLIGSNNKLARFELKSKQAVATDILDAVAKTIA
ncbi:MAG TPA: bifunctional phosphopantothenoylcysteine decarboxylase/phosphopantothenate--cysteine ligase CoaBC [Flavobacteriales bacterium]|nr:bifunctional phosphopantothenoylcysteine decarboxylase/phosphopantothenate--cysteine ligase CoaBC [Flavobacteriales bacterium]HRE75248.1 bifunctional phosphopantothenoylcysteine decarboxylase/phosphopantothenate--cysteine ligase CoaBC [Flavobacteriales bacterium]HRJ40157.1 bifunctional phosphopantothenoylcysteine decarboxylase/phosphopantothenate--cysteine ligase CoaBC [Flavobacteriales bacterium]